jgi:signal peptidase
MNKLKLLLNIFYGIVTAILLIIALSVAISYFGFPSGFKLFTVQSGSMEPTIHTGSIIISHHQSTYSVGDIITFAKSDDQTSVTHRLVEIKNDQFITKGDANNSPDSGTIDKKSIYGKTIFSIAYLGYPIAFARTQTGLIILIIIPSTIIIYSELVNIKNEIVKVFKAKHAPKNQ